MARITISINGTVEMTTALKGLKYKSENLRPFYLVYGNDMKHSVRESFEKARDPITLSKWKERNPMSLLSRRGKGGKTLQDTTKLLRSFVQAAPKISAEGVSIGSGEKYARIHQYGGTIRARKKYLTIPLDPAAKRLGYRAWRQKAEGAGQKPFVFRPKTGGDRMLAGITKGKGKNKRVQFIWLLKPSVDIPQRRYLGFGKNEKQVFVERAQQFFGGSL